VGEADERWRVETVIDWEHGALADDPVTDPASWPSRRPNSSSGAGIDQAFASDTPYTAALSWELASYCAAVALSMRAFVTPIRLAPSAASVPRGRGDDPVDRSGDAARR
jgi:hypothetical protein